MIERIISISNINNNKMAVEDIIPQLPFFIQQINNKLKRLTIKHGTEKDYN